MKKITAVSCSSLEVVPKKTMTWKCLDCRNTFPGPTDRTPKAGCAHCGSRHVIDINVEPVHPQLAQLLIEGIKDGTLKLEGIKS